MAASASITHNHGSINIIASVYDLNDSGRRAAFFNGRKATTDDMIGDLTVILCTIGRSSNINKALVMDYIGRSIINVVGEPMAEAATCLPINRPRVYSSHPNQLYC